MKWMALAMAIVIGALLAFLPAKLKLGTFISPLPSYLDLAKTFGVSTLNLWLPDLKKVISQEKRPEISAKAVLVYDLTTEKVIYAKNPKEKLPVASLVKIITAIIALESEKLGDVYTVSEAAVKVSEDSMGLTAGEKLSLEELLYGVLLVSGNDAAEVIAENFSAKGVATSDGSERQNFVKAMNDKARALGLTDTLFINPTGLEENGGEQ